MKKTKEIRKPSKRTAEKALTEAIERNKKRSDTVGKPVELGGPSDLEPTRYGDWERKGIVSDF